MADLQSEWVEARTQWSIAHDRMVDFELGLLQDANDGRVTDFTQSWDDKALAQLAQLEATEGAAREQRDLAWRRLLQSQQALPPSPFS
ncbi:MAG: hypothetical protein WD645_06030 [Dehalococcoidia bacterium]